jgi:hypothetical protein
MRENPLMSKENLKDLTNFVKKPNERLKWSLTQKRETANQLVKYCLQVETELFILWVPNSNYGIYVSPRYNQSEYKDWYEKYELEPSIL